MAREYAGQANFRVVYIREAHPVDGWQVPRNTREGIEIAQPRTPQERRQVAVRACSRLQLSMPCLVDGLDDAVGQAYAAWPDRLFVVDRTGHVVYAGAQGPRGFSSQELEAFLRGLAKP